MAKRQKPAAKEIRVPEVEHTPVRKGLVCPFLMFLPEATDGALQPEDFQDEDPCSHCFCSGLMGG